MAKHRDPVTEGLISEPFWRGTAMILQGESLRASQYVSHNASLGVLRERMLRHLIIEHVQGKFHVETGMVYRNSTDFSKGKTEARHSKQIDILIHDHLNFAPLYRYDDFVVVNYGALKACVEVKTKIDQSGFKDILAVDDSIWQLIKNVYSVSESANLENRRATFGFALDGVNFSTFRGYFSSLLDKSLGPKKSQIQLPLAIACEKQNYLAIRPAIVHDDDPVFFCAVKPRSKAPTELGVSTAMFISSLTSYLSSPDSLMTRHLYDWYNSLSTKHFEKFYLNSDGVWISANIDVGGFG